MRPVGDTGTAGHRAAGDATGDVKCGPGAWGRVLKPLSIFPTVKELNKCNLNEVDYTYPYK